MKWPPTAGCPFPVNTTLVSREQPHEEPQRGEVGCARGSPSHLDRVRLVALRILGGGEGVKSAGDQEHAEPVVVVVGEAAGDPAGEFDEPVHGLGAAVG